MAGVATTGIAIFLISKVVPLSTASDCGKISYGLPECVYEGRTDDRYWGQGGYVSKGKEWNYVSSYGQKCNLIRDSDCHIDTDNNCLSNYDFPKAEDHGCTAITNELNGNSWATPTIRASGYYYQYIRYCP